MTGVRATTWDWDKLNSQYADTYRLYALSDRQISLLQTAIECAMWRTRWFNRPSEFNVIEGFVGRTNLDLTSPIDLCAVIQACIGDQLTALQNSINDVASDLSDVAQDVADIDNRVDTLNTQNNARQPDPVSVLGCDEPAIFSGAIYLVQRFNQFIIDIFQRAEAAAAENQQEYLAIIFEAIPGLETLPVDELWELSNWYFSNQQARYEADYTLTFEEKAACELFCLILANDCVLNTTIIGDWLDGIIAAIPNNKAAEIYGRFAPSAQTFANQVNALVQGTQSLQSFFDDLHRQYAVGVLNQYPVPTSCDCNPLMLPIQQGTAFAREIPLTLSQTIEIEAQWTGVTWTARWGTLVCENPTYEISLNEAPGYTPDDGACFAGQMLADCSTSFCPTFPADPAPFLTLQSRKGLVLNSTTPFALRVRITAVLT